MIERVLDNVLVFEILARYDFVLLLDFLSDLRGQLLLHVVLDHSKLDILGNRLSYFNLLWDVYSDCLVRRL